MVYQSPRNRSQNPASQGLYGQSGQYSQSGLRGRATERLHEVTDYVKDKTSNVSRQVQDTAVQARDWFSDTFDEYPLAMGGAFLILGMASGFALPVSKPERRVIGQAGRRLMDQAQAVGSQLIDKGEKVAERAVETVKGTIGANRMSESE